MVHRRRSKHLTGIAADNLRAATEFAAERGAPINCVSGPRDRHIGYFNDYAGSLVENGFTVTPTKGKVPVVPKWQNPAPTNPDWLGKVLKAKRYAGCNIGIVCGRVVGIDIDADDPAKAAQLEALAAEHLGSTPFRRIGRAPRILLLYRPAENDRSPSIKIGDCIDVLSGGKQFVAYGIHPDTGKPYQWTSSRYNPATARLDELPLITAASVEAFAEAVCATLGSPQKGHPLPSLPTNNAPVDSPGRNTRHVRRPYRTGCGRASYRRARSLHGQAIGGAIRQGHAHLARRSGPSGSGRGLSRKQTYHGPRAAIRGDGGS